MRDDLSHAASSSPPLLSLSLCEQARGISGGAQSSSPIDRTGRLMTAVIFCLYGG